jgi:uncharacterized transporter YbjL
LTQRPGLEAVGLNVFIAIVGIPARPGFVDGLKAADVSPFLPGIFASSVPMLG